GIPGREDQPAIASELRDRNEAELALLQLALAVMVLRPCGCQLAVVAVGPAMVRATQEAGILAVGAADAHAAMSAGVQESTNDAVVVAHENGGINPAWSADHVSGIRNLALVPEEEPPAAENAVDLHLMDFRVGEDTPRDQALPGPDDRFEM